MEWLKTRLRLIPRRVYLVAGVVLIAAFLALGMLVNRQDAPAPITVPISELINRAEQGQIRSATISGNVILATDAGGIRYRAVKETQAPVTEQFRQAGVVVTVRGAEEPDLSVLVAFVPMIAIIGLIWFSMRRGGLNNQAFSFGRSNARMMRPRQSSITFDDVAGVTEAKQELSEIVQFLRHPEKFRALGARIPKGVLLVGPPGTGKTLISRAVAGEAGVPFFNISGSEFVEMFVGVGASRVRDLFRLAKRNSPCIVFIDEIDAVGRQRGTSLGGNDEREQTLNQLLVEMDGFDANTNVVVIAATNRPDVLDQALLRPGRFDRRVVLDPPDINGRMAILEVHTRGKPLADDVRLDDIARQTPGFSGADLANLVNEAAILAARSDRTTISRRDFDEGVLRVLAGPERKNRVITDYEKSIIAYHEVGHALVAKALQRAHPVTKVSIIARGQALGITMQTPKEDHYLISTAQLRARMASLLGGRVAEELVFGDVTTGAKQDLEMVTDIARRMVLEFGMSDLGIVPAARRDDSMGAAAMGEAMASQIDQSIKQLIDESYGLARSILGERRQYLEDVSEHLMRVETIDGDELTELLGPNWRYYEPAQDATCCRLSNSTT